MNRFEAPSPTVAVGLALAAVFADEPARWLVAEGPSGPADVAVVLAGDPGYERTRTAVRLWHEGQVSLLIMTGGEPGPGDSATSLRDEAVALGVPRGRILMEEVSHSTHEAMVAVRPLLERLDVRTRGDRDVALSPEAGVLGGAAGVDRGRDRESPGSSVVLGPGRVVAGGVDAADRAHGVREAGRTTCCGGGRSRSSSIGRILRAEPRPGRRTLRTPQHFPVSD